MESARQAASVVFGGKMKRKIGYGRSWLQATGKQATASCFCIPEPGLLESIKAFRWR